MNLQHIIVVDYMDNLLSGNIQCKNNTELGFYTKYVELNELIENDFPEMKKKVNENRGSICIFEIKNEINQFIRKFHGLYCKMNKYFKQWKHENITIAPNIHSLPMNQIPVVKTLTDIVDIFNFYTSIKQSQCRPLQS